MDKDQQTEGRGFLDGDQVKYCKNLTSYLTWAFPSLSLKIPYERQRLFQFLSIYDSSGLKLLYILNTLL